MTNAIIPEFQLSAQTHAGNVALKVLDLPKMVQFYTQVIGLELLVNDETTAALGTGTTPLLYLYQINGARALGQRTGLYHTAFLLPSRKDLGNALFHYITTNAPLSGAADHIYSEALYLTDPEGNGIEVYRDKPRSEWIIKEDGEIVSDTLEIDAEGVLQTADQQWSGFPAGTQVGHIHLSVADTSATQDFYTQILGLSLKTSFGPAARFFATGGYHHHIGANTWESLNAKALADNESGLKYYSYYVPDQNELDRIAQHMDQVKLNYRQTEDSKLWFIDPSGIVGRFELQP
ncbi:glyoxalase family protein [Ligilactobacillus salitolerans]|uniref:Glyoxalase family protein n=1 Tax=Ligilactobacillus salitolerans TaxID=1808352 RepID=A0A401ITD7_9LACO|nr:VOC family protein [Ligilactobacillus salitolerans]GBG94810.1 glyoxalase family protein [Ligilactobacillus salitolerans]